MKDHEKALLGIAVGTFAYLFVNSKEFRYWLFKAFEVCKNPPPSKNKQKSTASQKPI